MKRPIYWLIQIPAVLLAVLGAREMSTYRRTSEELLNAKSSLIAELESPQKNEKMISVLKERIEYFETSDLFDGSMYKGMVMVLAGFGLSLLAGKKAKNPDENNAMHSTETSSAE